MAFTHTLPPQSTVNLQSRLPACSGKCNVYAGRPQGYLEGGSWSEAGFVSFSHVSVPLSIAPIVREFFTLLYIASLSFNSCCLTMPTLIALAAVAWHGDIRAISLLGLFQERTMCFALTCFNFKDSVRLLGNCPFQFKRHKACHGSISF